MSYSGDTSKAGYSDTIVTTHVGDAGFAERYPVDSFGTLNSSGGYADVPGIDSFEGFHDSSAIGGTGYMDVTGDHDFSGSDEEV